MQCKSNNSIQWNTMKLELFLVLVQVWGFAFGFSCSEIAEYIDDGCRKMAVLKIPNDYSGLYTLEVNVSIPISINKEIEPIAEINNLPEIKIHPVDYLIYSVEYPTCVPEIRVTSAVFNGKLICKENPYTPTDKHGASTISVQIHHTSDIQRHHPESEIENRNIRNAYPHNPFLNGHNIAAKLEQMNHNELRQRLQNNPFLSMSVLTQNRPSPNVDSSFQPNPTYSRNPIEIDNPFLRNINSQYQNNVLSQSQKQDAFFQPRSSRPNSEIQPDSSNDCGLAADQLNLINGGQLAVNGDFPWTVAIFVRVGNGKKDTYICAGNQISDRHVLTAGHCTNVARHRLFAVPGIIHLDDVTAETAYDISAVNRHPKYMFKSPSHDIAILTVRNKMPGIPVCLWPSRTRTSQFVGAKGVVLGWGKYHKDINQVSEWLKMIEIPIVSQEMCIFSDNRLRQLVSTNTFCAGDRDMNGPCAGDSGGGFNINIKGRYYLRGIVSTAVSENKTCDLRHYIVFTDLASHLDWVKRIIDL